MSQEVELKLALPERAHAALRRHPLVAAAPRVGPVQTLVNTYYDTPELHLRREKVALRTRKQGRQWLQTVKCAALSAGGLSARPEWEGPWAGQFDFSAVDQPAVHKLLLRHAEQLVPLFTTTFRRETRRYAPRPGVSILIMIDKGQVESGERQSPISEVELELEQGEPADLLALARTLAEAVSLLPEDISKAQRGYQLFAGEKLRPLRASASRLDRQQSPLAAFRCVAEDGLRQWQGNAAGALQAHEPEFIHQLRVALRRLRSALRLFAPALPEAFVSRWSQQFGETAEQLGEARDLDVLFAEIVRPVQEAAPPEEIPMAALVASLEARRTAARAHVARKLDPAAQGRLMLDFLIDLHALPENALHASADLGQFATLQLADLRRAARKRWRRAADLEPAQLHRLRIALKRLRYGVEFFTPLLPAKATARYAKALAVLQDDLGYFNDVAVARARLQHWAGDDLAQRIAISYLAGWHAARCARISPTLLPRLKPLLFDKAPWKEK